MWDTAAALVSALIGIVGLIAGWVHWRRTELRKEDVLAWANDVIESLQNLALVLTLKENNLSSDRAKQRIEDIIFKTSTLVERGRLFFQNQKVDDWGKEKPSAYQGYRPIILDQIVIAHQVACAWADADDHKRERMKAVSLSALREFVSLVQKEVGRGRTASADTQRGGSGINLDYLLSQQSSPRDGSKKPSPRST